MLHRISKGLTIVRSCVVEHQMNIIPKLLQCFILVLNVLRDLSHSYRLLDELIICQGWPLISMCPIHTSH